MLVPMALVGDVAVGVVEVVDMVAVLHGLVPAPVAVLVGVVVVGVVRQLALVPVPVVPAVHVPVVEVVGVAIVLDTWVTAVVGVLVAVLFVRVMDEIRSHWFLSLVSLTASLT